MRRYSWIAIACLVACGDAGPVEPPPPGENSAPEAADLVLELDEDGEVSAALPISDPDGDELVVGLLDVPELGELIFDERGITFTGYPDAFGTEDLTYSVGDGSEAVTAMLTVVIAPVNDAPVADSAVLSTGEDTAAQVTLSANDVDSDELTVEIADSTLGTLVVGDDLDLSFIPSPNVSGTEVVEFTVSDGELESDVRELAIEVLASNDAPAGVDSSFDVESSRVIFLQLQGADVETDPGSLSFEIIDGPEHGSLVLANNGAVTYQSDDFFVGADSFTFAVSDGVSTSAPATVDLDVYRPDAGSVFRSYGFQSLDWDAVYSGPNAVDIAGTSLVAVGGNRCNVAVIDQSPAYESSFGSAGSVITSFGTGANDIQGATAVRAVDDGSILVAGWASVEYDPQFGFSDYYLAVARYQSDGSLDTSLQGTGKALVHSDDIDVSYQAEGSSSWRADGMQIHLVGDEIWVVGQMVRTVTTPGFSVAPDGIFLVRLSSEGSLIASEHMFKDSQLEFADAVRFDGGLAISGSPRSGTSYQLAWARIDSSGASSSLELVETSIVNPNARALVPWTGGGVAIAGNSMTASGAWGAPFLVAVDGNGQTSDMLGTLPATDTSAVMDLVADGQRVALLTQARLYRVTRDSGLDVSFSDDGVTSYGGQWLFIDRDRYISGRSNGDLYLTALWR